MFRRADRQSSVLRFAAWAHLGAAMLERVQGAQSSRGMTSRAIAAVGYSGPEGTLKGGAERERDATLRMENLEDSYGTTYRSSVGAGIRFRSPRSAEVRPKHGSPR